jgi:hypothetical protein
MLGSKHEESIFPRDAQRAAKKEFVAEEEKKDL